MNPRIYKKQAKRAVELLRSHGDTSVYKPSEECGVMDAPHSYKRGKWLKAHRPAEFRMWETISGIPETCYQCFDEWEGHDSRKGWERHYEASLLPEDFFSGDEWDTFGGKPWPRQTTKQRMDQWRFSQIAPGWRWRGGKAVKISI